MFPESIVPSADGSAGRGWRDIPETGKPADVYLTGPSAWSSVPGLHSKALGLTIPQAILLLADQVSE